MGSRSDAAAAPAHRFGPVGNSLAVSGRDWHAPTDDAEHFPGWPVTRLVRHYGAMETLLALPAVSFGDERHDVADLVLAGLLTGEWQALEDVVARGLGLEAAGSGQVDAGEVESALEAFRYERRLIAAADLRGWLSERDLRLADLEGVLRRQLLRARFDGVRCPAAATPLAGTVMRAEAMCAGTLRRLAGELCAWHAGGDWLTQRTIAESSDWSPTADPAEVQDLVAAALADVASGLSVLGSAKLWPRAERLAALKACYAHFRAAAVTDGAVDARLAEHRLEWTVVTGSELSFEFEGAARETRLRVVHDGDTLAQVAEMVGIEPVRRELELGSAPAEIGPELLAARDGDLVGPWCEGGRWRVLQLAGRFEPEQARDGGFRARAREELLGELVERVSAGKAGILAVL